MALQVQNNVPTALYPLLPLTQPFAKVAVDYTYHVGTYLHT